MSTKSLIDRRLSTSSTYNTASTTDETTVRLSRPAQQRTRPSVVNSSPDAIRGKCSSYVKILFALMRWLTIPGSSLVKLLTPIACQNQTRSRYRHSPHQCASPPTTYPRNFQSTVNSLALEIRHAIRFVLNIEPSHQVLVLCGNSSWALVGVALEGLDATKREHHAAGRVTYVSSHSLKNRQFQGE